MSNNSNNVHSSGERLICNNYVIIIVPRFAVGSLTGYPIISYIWLTSLTFNPVTIIYIKQQKKTIKENETKKYIYTNINNQSNI